MIQKLAVIGLGLIGGSLARDLRASGFAKSIVGFDLDAGQVDAALQLGVIDRAGRTAAAAVTDADMVVVSVPVLHTADALRELLPGLLPGATVTDVGSTKQSVLRDVARVCGDLPPWFVAGHPIAGTEKSGVANSMAGLFKGHRVILTPHAAQNAQAQARVAAMWQSAGARVVQMNPDQHDEIFAATSHLPHLLAYSYVDMLDRLDAQHEIFPNAGGGFRDFTRIASSSPQMWHDVVRANKDSVSMLLRKQIDELQILRQMIEQERWDEVYELFQRARAARERYLAKIE
ncbi:MAG: prephenate dehydrogenase [Stenotrophobium sp.]